MNFGWAGVVGFSAVVGLLLRLFAQSKDEAFRALWLLFCVSLFAAGLLGIAFSNGFLLVFLLVIFTRIGATPTRTKARSLARTSAAAASRTVMPWERKV